MFVTGKKKSWNANKYLLHKNTSERIYFGSHANKKVEKQLKY